MPTIVGYCVHSVAHWDIGSQNLNKFQCKSVVCFQGEASLESYQDSEVLCHCGSQCIPGPTRGHYDTVPQSGGDPKILKRGPKEDPILSKKGKSIYPTKPFPLPPFAPLPLPLAGCERRPRALPPLTWPSTWCFPKGSP